MTEPVAAVGRRPVSRVVRYLQRLRTEGEGTVRESAAVGLGVFIGCLPLIGFHLALTLAVGWALGLNRLKMYLAANVSSPPVLPLLLLTEAQIGRFVLERDLYGWADLSFESLRENTLRVATQLGLELIVGGVLLGVVVGSLAAFLTFVALRQSELEPRVAALVHDAAERFVVSGITAWEFARSKIRHDPVYLDLLRAGKLPRSGTLVDIGCGPGLMLALVAASRAAFEHGRWPEAWPPPPADLTLTGIERRPRAARVAREALGPEARIVEADASAIALESASGVLVFDVLHLNPEAAQERLLDTIAGLLEPGGVVIVREANPAAGWRFRLVALGNRVTALMRRQLRPTFAFRSLEAWTAALERRGIRVERLDADARRQANVVIVGHRTER
ncbi:MAG: class I SAM-dependent methyltransferase [Vicinamibacterales bacterium]